MRSLKYIPTIHDISDSPSAKILENDQSAKIARYKTVKDLLWKSIHREIVKEGEYFAGVKVFAEGIDQDRPVIDPPLPFSLAKKRLEQLYPNAQQIVLSLALQWSGATMIKTEDRDHLMAVHQDLSSLREGDPARILTNEERQQYDDALARRLSHWDGNIAQQINSNLVEGEKGIVIAGIAHNAIKELQDDIFVSFVSPEAELIWKFEREGKDVFLQEYFNELVEGMGMISPKSPESR